MSRLVTAAVAAVALVTLCAVARARRPAEARRAPDPIASTSRSVVREVAAPAPAPVPSAPATREAPAARPEPAVAAAVAPASEPPPPPEGSDLKTKLDSVIDARMSGRSMFEILEMLRMECGFEIVYDGVTAEKLQGYQVQVSMEKSRARDVLDFMQELGGFKVEYLNGRVWVRPGE